MLDRILKSIARKPTVGVVGLASWDTVLAVDVMPSPGGFTLVDETVDLPGGTSANAAATAASLGARVDFISTVGQDAVGERLLQGLAAVGIDSSYVKISTEEPTDQTTVITSLDPPNRTIFWRKGALPRRGDRIDIDRLFTRQVVLLDSVDPTLRRFLIDLPVHTYPDVKILVPIAYVIDFPGPDELDSIVRCDALVGSADELMTLMDADSLDLAVERLQARMRVSNLRQVAVTRGAAGALAFDTNRMFEIPAIEVQVVDTTGAGDAFAGAFALAIAARLELLDALVLANCVAGLACRSIGAQTSLPTVEELEINLRQYLDRVRP